MWSNISRVPRTVILGHIQIISLRSATYIRIFKSCRKQLRNFKILPCLIISIACFSFPELMANSSSSMVTKLVTFQRAAASKKSEKISPVTSCRERASNIWPSHQKTNMQDDQRTSHTSYKPEQTGNPQLVKKKMKQFNQWAAQELPGLGFCYVTPSVRYILRKAKVFYKELCCDRYNNTTPVAVLNEQPTTVDAYFSIPVIPPPTLP